MAQLERRQGPAGTAAAGMAATFVIAVMVLGLPKDRHRAALRYGLIGAFVFRVGATLLAIYLIRVIWVKLLGGGYLLYLAYSHFTSRKSEEQRRSAPKATAWLGMSPFWATVVRVELVNLAFSIDSILVAVAVSPKLWVILSGGILGIVAIRLVVQQLIAMQNNVVADVAQWEAGPFEAAVEWMDAHGAPRSVSGAVVVRARHQLGTLGGGNHFIEVCVDREDGKIWTLLHSGSRNVGKTVADAHIARAK